MISIDSIDVVNIRSLGAAVFAPLSAGEGSTALTGANGRGKSSILAAAVWALFGATPDGVPVSAMRRQGTTPGTDECRATVTFVHDNQRIVVERGLKGSKDATYVKITVDGQETTFGKVRAAEEWVTTRLGMDVEGFLTAFVVRQKELDGLIKARPADRRRLIERLAGIERMSAAVKVAREDEAAAKRHVDMFPGNDDALAEARDTLTAAEAGLTTTAAKLTTAAAALEAATLDRDEASTVVEQHTKSAALVREFERAKQAADTDIALTERDLAAGKETLQATENAASGYSLAALEAATEARAAAAAAQREAQRIIEAVTVARTQQAECANRVAAAEARVTEINTRAKNLERDLQEITSATTMTVEEATQKKDTLLGRVGELRAEHQRLNEAIAALTTTDKACCPTCATALADPEALISSLRSALATIQEEGKKVQQDATEAEAAALKVTQAHTQGERVSASLAAETRAATEAEDVLLNLQEAHEAATAQAAEAAKEAQAAMGEEPRLREQATQTEQVVRELEKARDAHDTLDDARARVETLAEAHRAAQQRAAGLTRPVDLPTEEEVVHAQQFAAETNIKWQNAKDAHHTADTDHTTAAHRVSAATADVERAEEQQRAREEARAVFETKTATRAALDDFRKDRVGRIAPELSELATELVTQMSDGKFTALELDDEFTPTITDIEGQARPAAWLSGGEESIVALALRIAIGELMAGQQGGLLWLDEVLTAQDSDRRPAVMRSIGSLTGRQVIMINHVAEATDMVDAVFEVTSTENGSTIVSVGSAPSLEAEAVA